MSLATQAVATAEVLKFPIVAVVALEAVCFVINTDELFVVMSVAKQFHPVVAVGNPMTPLVAEPPVPTLMRKDAVPLFDETEGLEPKPDEIVGAALEIKRFVSVRVVNFPVLGVVPPIAPGAAKVAPLRELAFKFATF